jgi:SSS family solute:Na+ symporter
VSLDIVRRVRPDTPEKKLVLIGRIATGVIMLLAMAWSTQGDQFGTIFEAINKIPMTFAPAVTTVFVLGVMWPRGNARGAMTTLYVGTLIGVAYFLLDLPSVGRAMIDLPQGQAFTGLVTDPVRGLGVPFMLVGPALTALCIAIYVSVSLATTAPDRAKLAGLAWERPLDFVRGPLRGVGDPRIISICLFVAVAALYAWLH